MVNTATTRRGRSARTSRRIDDSTSVVTIETHQVVVLLMFWNNPLIQNQPTGLEHYITGRSLLLLG